MERQTRQLLRLLGDDLTDRLIGELAEGAVLETDLQQRVPGSRQTIARRLEDLETWGVAISETRPTPGRGRPTRAWWLAVDEVSRFRDAADEFLLGLLEGRAARHRQAIRHRADDRGRVTLLRKARSD